MAGTAISIDIDDKQVMDRLKELRDRFGNLRPVMKAIGQTIRTSVVENFQDGGRPGAWAPLSPATLLQKRGSKVLIDKGFAGGLMGSIHEEAGEDYVLVGTNKVYAAMHQFGYKGPVTIPAHTRVIRQAFGKMLANPKAVSVRSHTALRAVPARPFLMVQNEDVIEILELMNDYLMG